MIYAAKLPRLVAFTPSHHWIAITIATGHVIEAVRCTVSTVPDVSGRSGAAGLRSPTKMPKKWFKGCKLRELPSGKLT